MASSCRTGRTRCAISVIVPAASSYTSAQRAARVATGILWSAGLQGAIDGAVITGTLNP